MTPALAAVLKRLADIELDPVERRTLLFEHAQVLSWRLARAAEAVPICSSSARRFRTPSHS